MLDVLLTHKRPTHLPGCKSAVVSLPELNPTTNVQTFTTRR